MSEIYTIAATAAVGLMALIATINILAFRTVCRDMRPRSTPGVSVLLPARNEENNIGLCLATLAEQDYPDYEILVLNDNSEDSTASIVAEWQEHDARVRLLHGAPLPRGWVGKNFACHQLAQAARGELLLFTDADTIHSPQTLSAAVAEMERSKADLLTMIPQQVMAGFWEKLILPMLYFSSMCFLPFPLVGATRSPKLAMANGQFMLFKRSAYEAIGGHDAVRTALVEDVWLSRLIKKHGYRLSVVDGKDVLSCRMYTSFSGIWEGFSKNLFPGFRYSLGMLLAVVLFNAATSVGPFAVLVLGDQEMFSPAGLQVALLLAIRVGLAVRFNMSVLYSLLHPLAMIFLIAIALNSSRLVLLGGGSRWKGRSYDFRDSSISTITR